MKKTVGVLSLIVMLLSQIITPFTYAVSGDELPVPEPVVEEQDVDSVEEEVASELAEEVQQPETGVVEESFVQEPGDTVDEGIGGDNNMVVEPEVQTGVQFGIETEISSGDIEQLTGGEKNLEEGISDEPRTGKESGLIETIKNFFGIGENKGGEESFESREIYGTGEYEGVKVEVYAQTGLFASGTELTIEPVIEEKLETVQEVLLSGEVDFIKEQVVAFDITFRDPVTQEELQPKDGTVQVTFNYEENESLVQAEENEEQEVKVYHLNDIDEEGNKIEELTGTTVEEVVVNEEESEEENVMVVEAESFSVYTIIVQVAEGLDNQLSNFVWNDIIIRDPNNPLSGFVLMDRNLGAKSVGGIGYFYMRGNNYGFSMKGDNGLLINNVTMLNGRTGTKEADSIPRNNLYLNSGFKSNVLLPTAEDYRKDGTFRPGVWGGGGDNASNNYGLDLHNYEDRQGPCPEGWHIPSMGEWKELIEYRYSSYSLKGQDMKKTYSNANGASMIVLEGDGIATLLRNDLHIPYGSYCYYSTYSQKVECYGYSNHSHLQSSSYIQATYASNYGLYLGQKYNGGSYNYDIRTRVTSQRYAYQIRCFKNEYEQPNIYNVKFHFNDEIIEKIVIGGEKVIIPSLIPSNGYIIDGWYTDSEFTNKYNFSSLIANDIDLYAREVPFEYGTIYISDPDNPLLGYAIMDRNLGAKEAGTGEDSYGYLFQWGNNYGFSNTGMINEIYNKLEWNNNYNNSGYYNTGFWGSSNSIWKDGKFYGGLRGGSGDAQSNNWGLDNIAETVIYRKGPCPEGWHVPSIGEWSKVLEYRIMNQKGYSNSDISAYKQNGLQSMYLYNKWYNIFLNDLKLPFGGYRSSRNYLYGQGNARVFEYRSSSPNSSSINIFYTYSTAGFFMGSSTFEYGHSVRCFKNDYNPNIHIVSFETFEGNAFDSKSVLIGKQLRLNAQPSRNGYYFGGWYTDEELTIPYDFSLPVNNDFTLYAKWNSPVVVSFQTNGGIAFDNEYIEPGKTLQLKSDPQKYGYFFKGWYTDEELTIPYDFSLPVNNDFTLYAKWDNHFGTISISDPNNSLSGFTIMDRNLGAKEAGTGEDSYGYLYQRGNNYGFLNSSNINTTTRLAEWNDEYENNGYYGTQFITTYYGPYDYWSGSYFHDGLRGGSGDNEGNNRGLDNIEETVVNRRGPCPEGWHIPSAGEWSKVIEYFKKTYDRDNNTHNEVNSSSNSLNGLTLYGEKIQEYFQIPFAGYLYQGSNSAGKSNGNGYYWSSSVYYSNSRSAYVLYISNNPVYSWYMYNRTQGNSIRCFKNEYEIPSIHAVFFYTNGGNAIQNMEIRENHKLIGLPTPTRENSIFEGWYLDKDFTKEYDFNQLISGDLKFYAKWGCQSGYTLSEDLQSCEKIAVKFRANGGTFGNDNIYVINSSTKNIKSDIIKYSHTHNINDEGIQSGVYANGLNTVADVVTIPGVKKLHITIIYGGESATWDWACMWEGNHPNYTATNNCGTSVTGKLGGGNHTSASNVKEYIVEGDTVTFSFRSDGGGVGDGYGYYAVITETDNYETEYSGDAFDNIPEPTREGYDFTGWYFDNGTFNNEFNVSEVITGDSMNVYAKWNPHTYTIRFDLNGGTGEVDDIIAKYGERITLPKVSRLGYYLSGWESEDGTMYKDSIPEGIGLTPEEGGIAILTAQWLQNAPAAGGGQSITTKAKEQEHEAAEEKQEDKQEEKQELKQEEQTEEQTNVPETNNSSSQSSTQQSSSSSKEITVTVDPEILSAYEWAYENNITTIPSLDEANPDGPVTRGHLAKMVVNYATNVLGQEIPEKIPSECRWNDWRGDWESEEIKDYAVKSCALGLMGLDMPKFLPNMEVTRAQFGTIMSRLLWGKKYAGGTPYYRKHLNALKENNIMTQIENPEKRVELRQWVWLMLMRSAQNK